MWWQYYVVQGGGGGGDGLGAPTANAILWNPNLPNSHMICQIRHCHRCVSVATDIISCLSFSRLPLLITWNWFGDTELPIYLWLHLFAEKQNHLNCRTQIFHYFRKIVIKISKIQILISYGLNARTNTDTHTYSAPAYTKYTAAIGDQTVLPTTLTHSVWATILNCGSVCLYEPQPLRSACRWAAATTTLAGD